MGRRAKDTPDWTFIACPVCGVGAGVACRELVTVHLRGYNGERATHRRDKPHQARVEVAANVRAWRVRS